MARTIDELLAEALQLSEGDRCDLAHRLWESVEAPPNTYATDEEFEAELKRRMRSGSFSRPTHVQNGCSAAFSAA